MGISKKTQRELDRLSGHMEPEIIQDDAWIVETDRGESFVVPAQVEGIDENAKHDQTYEADDIHGHDPAPCLSVFEDYQPESAMGRIVSATVKRDGWVCRMSAPGYLDCSEWEWHPTEQSAADSIVSQFGE